MHVIGHNGGPPLNNPRGKKLSASQLRALQGIRDHGNSAHGLWGASQFGGWNNTHDWLVKHKLSICIPNGSKQREVLTKYGEAVLAAGRLVSREAVA